MWIVSIDAVLLVLLVVVCCWGWGIEAAAAE
jgi:hypothetical protein